MASESRAQGTPSVGPRTELGGRGTAPAGAPAHPGPDPRPSAAVPEVRRQHSASGSARAFRSLWRRGVLAWRRLWGPSTRPWARAAPCGSRRRAPATCAPATSWRRGGRCRRASGPGRCPSESSMPWSACRAPAWPRCCAASRPPRGWRSGCSARPSSSVCSGPWAPTPRPPDPPLGAPASSCTAPRCGPPPARSASASCEPCSWPTTWRGLCALTGVSVRLVPAVRDPHLSAFLQRLRVDWPTASEPASADALRSRALAEVTSGGDPGALPAGVLGSVCLKELLGGPGLAAGRDHCLVTEDLLSQLAELQAAAQPRPEDCADSCVAVHVVSPEEEFQQQQLDLLWWKLDEQAPLRQKHLVCGPVRAAGAPSTLTAPEYYELRLAQVRTASALKHSRDLAQDPAWTETLRVLSVATIKFEMLSKAPQSQLFLDLADSVPTKGTRSGTFVMYNCARLATLFEGYQRGVEQGLYPTFPPASSLDFSLLREEGEWLLLFNSILPFPGLLSQAAALNTACPAPGPPVTARTEMVCKFLVQLSMDFSSYYNRVHILGEPRPHLFGQMFARLQLLRAVQEVLHSGLATLGLPPLSHV